MATNLPNFNAGRNNAPRSTLSRVPLAVQAKNKNEIFYTKTAPVAPKRAGQTAKERLAERKTVAQSADYGNYASSRYTPIWREPTRKEISR